MNIMVEQDTPLQPMEDPKLEQVDVQMRLWNKGLYHHHSMTRNLGAEPLSKEYIQISSSWVQGTILFSVENHPFPNTFPEGREKCTSKP